MGYTIENKKIVIWTVKEFRPEKYPFQSEGENITVFFENLHGKPVFECPARLTVEEKESLVSEKLQLKPGTFFLISKKEHYNKRRKKQPKK